MHSPSPPHGHTAVTPPLYCRYGWRRGHSGGEGIHPPCIRPLTIKSLPTAQCLYPRPAPHSSTHPQPRPQATGGAAILRCQAEPSAPTLATLPRRALKAPAPTGGPQTPNDAQTRGLAAIREPRPRHHTRAAASPPYASRGLAALHQRLGWPPCISSAGPGCAGALSGALLYSGGDLSTFHPNKLPAPCCTAAAAPPPAPH